ncbi:MAG: hypothetical protein AB4352_27965 [Hormoscilla sp.]
MTMLNPPCPGWRSPIFCLGTTWANYRLILMMFNGRVAIASKCRGTASANYR